VKSLKTEALFTKIWAPSFESTVSVGVPICDHSVGAGGVLFEAYGCWQAAV
jgi:hypothetical protein